MRPSLDRERRTAWLVVGLTCLVGGIFLMWWYDWGETSSRLGEAREAYQKRIGRFRLELQRHEQALANELLHQRIVELKSQVGIRETPPYRVPKKATNENMGHYWKLLYGATWENLKKRAVAINNLPADDYDTPIGFDKFSRGQGEPTAAQTPYYLTMLQLVTKAVYLAQAAPSGTIRMIRIDDVDPERVVPTGPAGRPALLREFPFTLKIKGSLQDISWLLHVLCDDLRSQQQGEEPAKVHQEFEEWLQNLTALAKEKLKIEFDVEDRPTEAGNAVCPLIVRGLHITGPFDDAKDQVPMFDERVLLEATFDLAGMQFLSDQERQLEPIRAAGSRAPGRGVFAMP